MLKIGDMRTASTEKMYAMPARITTDECVMATGVKRSKNTVKMYGTPDRTTFRTYVAAATAGTITRTAVDTIARPQFGPIEAVDSFADTKF